MVASASLPSSTYLESKIPLRLLSAETLGSGVLDLTYADAY
jgi:hypothetical protein